MPTLGLLNRLRAWENEKLRSLDGTKRAPGEIDVAWCYRTAAKHRKMRDGWGIKAVADMYLEELHRVGGQFVRAKGFGGKPSIVVAAVRWRSEEWWKTAQRLGLDSDTRNLQRWRTARPGRTTKWEDLFVAKYGLNWHSIALVAREWVADIQKFAKAQLKFAKGDEIDADRVGLVELPPRDVRVVLPCVVPWLPPDILRGETFGDNKLVIDWANGSAVVQRLEWQPIVADIRSIIG